METRYEIEPERVGRATDRRRPAALIAVALIVVAAVLDQAVGWRRRPTVQAVRATPEPVGRGRPATAADPRPSLTTPSPAADPDLAVRARPVPPRDADREARPKVHSARSPATPGRGASGRPASGRGCSATSPGRTGRRRRPRSSTAVPLHIAIWPGTGLCTGYPTIYDQPTLVAVTTPRDVAPDRVLRGWWTDGGERGHRLTTRSSRSRRRAIAGSAISSAWTGRRGRPAVTSSTSSSATASVVADGLPDAARLTPRLGARGSGTARRPRPSPAHDRSHSGRQQPDEGGPTWHPTRRFEPSARAHSARSSSPSPRCPSGPAPVSGAPAGDTPASPHDHGVGDRQGHGRARTSRASTSG